MNLQEMVSNNQEVLVQNVGGVLVADSLGVADRFGKKHKDVLEAVDKLAYEITTQSAENSADYFIQDSYQDARNRTQRKYLLTRDGFSLLVMGFTGKSVSLRREQLSELGSKFIHLKLRLIRECTGISYTR